jgi:hypothetical protein
MAVKFTGQAGFVPCKDGEPAPAKTIASLTAELEAAVYRIRQLERENADLIRQLEATCLTETMPIA